MKKTIKTFAAAAVCALAMLASVSCDNKVKPGEGGDGTVEYTLALKYATHESIYIPAQNAEDHKVDLNTNLTISQLAVSEKDGKEWCLASLIEEEGVIKVLLDPVDGQYDIDLTATFVVSAVGVEGVAPLEFKVTREKYVYLTLNPDISANFNYSVKADGETLAITVNTNADKWYFIDEADDKSWYSADITEGADGAVITFTFNKNTTSGEYGYVGQFNFGVMRTKDENGEALATPAFESLIYVAVMQPKYVETTNAATSVTVSDMMSGEIANGGRIDFEADPFMGAYLTITTTPAEAGYEVKFFEYGTSTELGADAWVSFAPMGDTTILSVTTNTGAERKADMAIFGAGSEPIFKCTVVQAGA